MQISVVSRTKALFQGEAEKVTLPSETGQIGILTGHAPILGVLGEGLVRVTDYAGKVTNIEVSKGFFSVDEDIVTVACFDGKEPEA
ncbi:F0F1 ATP synthase subunit epsilon [Actinomycetaceae bacterium TAE3-ERU4]|nr:F0F1 ATP synthase subunit epsilon [Actinomycetaceae bacterium TAE3-ERU4]